MSAPSRVRVGQEILKRTVAQGRSVLKADTYGAPNAAAVDPVLSFSWNKLEKAFRGHRSAGEHRL
jgi:hypothetical protein